MAAVEWDLLERISAAARDARNIHNDLCQSFEEPDQDDGQPWPCTCGVPDLLRDLAEHLQAQAAAGLVREITRPRKAA